MNERTLANHIDAADAYLSQLESEERPPEFEHCPACGAPIEWCQGHGELGDPDGFLILALHDNDDHSECHSAAECQTENGAP